MKRTGFMPYAFVALTVITFTSCDPFGTREREREPAYPATAEGWAPIYNKGGNTMDIKSMDPRSIEKEGKIYVKGDTLYQVEAGKGIHVIDIKQPANPQKIAFISVVGAQEMAVKDNILYTNNLNDLVMLDVSNVKDVKVLDRITSVFHMVDPNAPPGTGYYECVNSSKGTVVGWEQKTIQNPQCRK